MNILEKARLRLLAILAYMTVWLATHAPTPQTRLISDIRGASKVNDVIMLAIAVMLAGYLVPMGLQSIAVGNYTGVDPVVKTVFTVVFPILAVIGLAIKFVQDIRSE